MAGGCSAEGDAPAHPWGAAGHHGQLCPSAQCWLLQHDLSLALTNQAGSRSVAAGRVPLVSLLPLTPAAAENSELGGDARTKATARKDPLD